MTDLMPERKSTRQSSRTSALALLINLFICSHACVDVAAQGLGQDSATFRAIDQEAQQGAMGYTWLRWSTQHIGHRLTGSPNGVRAEETADSLFRIAGCADVAYFPFTASAWQRRTVHLTLHGASDSTATLTAVALALTPDSADVTAGLIDLGNGLAADFDSLGERVRGRCVVMNLGLVRAPKGIGNLHRSEKCALAIAHGAAAIVFINNVAGHVLLTGTASVTGDPIAIPAACIGSEEGEALRNWLAKDPGVAARLAMTNSNARVSARNVIATIPGSSRPDEVILVGGHLDSWDLATGATDNGLGSYSVLDMARCFQALGLRPERTVKFVLFMGEEEGLLGSSALVAEWKKSGALEQVRCMINLDMSGHPNGFVAVGPTDWRRTIDAVNAEMRAQDSTFAGTSDDTPGLHSDHQPFMLEGVPVIAPICDLGSRVYGCYHSSCDDIHLVDPQAMVDNVRRVVPLIWALANAHELPRRFTDAELKARLQSAGLEEKLRLQRDWRW